MSLLYPFLIITTLYAFKFYEYSDDLNEALSRSIFGITIGSLFLFAFCKLFDIQFFTKKLMLILLIFIFILPFLNYILSKISSKTIKPIRYLVVGRKSEIYNILKEIEEKSKGKYQFVEYINPSPVTFKEKIAQYDNVLITDPQLEKEIGNELEQIRQTHKIEYLPNLAEMVLKRIPLEVMQKFEEYYKVYFDNIKESPAKRVMDIFFSLIGLVVYSPVILISAIWILIEDGPPVLFRQPRVGKNEKIFEMLKLRSLRVAQIDPTNPNKDIEQRVLKIGKFIRKTRIDESIQFWLILKGKMSLVGPRPEMIEYHEMMKPHIPYYTYRLLVKPGLTGWAQINYKHSSTLEEYKIKTEYDLYYAKNRSIFLDLRIILQTLERLVFKDGAR
jgi:lipopolysaccharide/colanic/teichoic acid biosynthesis glycosyltransferase